MRKHKKAIALLTAVCLLLATFFTQSAFADATTSVPMAETDDVEVYEDIDGYIDAVARMNAERPAEEDEITISVNEELVGSGDVVAPVDEAAMSGDAGEAAEILEDAGYEIVLADGDSITATDPFASCRLTMTYDGDVPITNTVRAVRYDNDYVLQYADSVSAARAYEEFRSMGIRTVSPDVRASLMTTEPAWKWTNVSVDDVPAYGEHVAAATVYALKEEGVMNGNTDDGATVDDDGSGAVRTTAPSPSETDCDSVAAECGGIDEAPSENTTAEVPPVGDGAEDENACPLTKRKMRKTRTLPPTLLRTCHGA